MCKFLCGAAPLYRTANCNIIRKTLCEISYQVIENYELNKSHSYAQVTDTRKTRQNKAE